MAYKCPETLANKGFPGTYAFLKVALHHFSNAQCKNRNKELQRTVICKFSLQLTVRFHFAESVFFAIYRLLFAL